LEKATMKRYASTRQLQHVVQAASLAPSVHNTQPWHFVQVPHGLALHADESRRLSVLDPDGRQMHLSCGAALFQARAAARALGLDAAVTLMPAGESSDWLADIELTKGDAPTEAEIRTATAILRRHTFRGAFEQRIVPAELVEDFRLDAEREGGLLLHVADEGYLVELEVLLSRADMHEESDEGYRRELARWVHAETTASDGVPDRALGMVAGSSLRQRDFSLARPEAADGSAPVAEHPVVVVLATADDERASWLRAGQALAAVLLRAASAGVQAQPLGQVTDLPAYRQGLRSALGMVGTPQLVLRMGYAAPTGATPRRELDDVLTVR
jgi:hypothetical protein